MDECGRVLNQAPEPQVPLTAAEIASLLPGSQNNTDAAAPTEGVSLQEGAVVKEAAVAGGGGGGDVWWWVGDQVAARLLDELLPGILTAGAQALSQTQSAMQQRQVNTSNGAHNSIDSVGQSQSCMDVGWTVAAAGSRARSDGPATTTGPWNAGGGVSGQGSAAADNQSSERQLADRCDWRVVGVLAIRPFRPAGRYHLSHGLRPGRLSRRACSRRAADADK